MHDLKKKSDIIDKFFDEPWYTQQYPDVTSSGLRPLEHYLRFGWKEGQRPHPLFDPLYYLESNQDVRDDGIDPFVHYILHGEEEGRRPNRFFDPRFYSLQANIPIRGSLAHYVSNKTRVSPSDDFDAAYYASEYNLDENDNALMHYFKVDRSKVYYVHPLQAAQLQNDLREVAQSGLFDGAFYLRVYEDIAHAGMDPLLHYTKYGFAEGRTPHPLFDVPHYLKSRSDLRLGSDDVLLHFIRVGWKENASPHPFFDMEWYRKTYSHLFMENNPLSYYLTDRSLRTSPSRKFDSWAYARRYSDVVLAGVNPLMHYLESGRQEGRLRFPVIDGDFYASRATSARMATLKPSSPIEGNIALFVTHSGNGRIKQQLEIYFRALRSASISIVLVIASDLDRIALPDFVCRHCAMVVARENVGYDFAAWAHVLAEYDWLYNASTLFLLNDSVIGPVGDARFSSIIDSIQDSSASVVGLVDNYYHAYHISSFFLALKSTALKNIELHRFFRDVQNLEDKDEVIQHYEITFTQRLRAAGLKIEVLFPGYFEGVNGRNRVIFDWDEMLDEGFPFVKASLVNGEHKDKGGQRVIESLAKRGFEITSLNPTANSKQSAHWQAFNNNGSVHERLRVAYIGPSNYANSLAVAARGYVSALFCSKFDYNIHPLTKPFHIHGQATPNWQVRTFDGPPDVVLVHVNGEGYDALINDEQRALLRSARKRIAMFVWETDIVPTNWLRAVAEADAIWVPTEFCASAFRPLTNVPVEVIPYVVEPEENERPLDGCASIKTSFGLPAKKSVILYVFDSSSFLARKNPHALVRAFLGSGLDRNGWHLVLKTKHLHRDTDEARSLLALVERSASVSLLDRAFSHGELEDLFLLCDIYASPHASEGFGLTIAEAMAAGKVVVATDYGGSRDFLDETCGFPVKAETYVLDEDVGPYLSGSTWAKIDEAELSNALVRAAHATKDGKLGAAAKRQIGRLLSREAVSTMMEASIESLARSTRER